MPPKNNIFTKAKQALGLGPKKCICKQEADGKFYCYKMDSGKLVQCIGKGPFNTLQECQQSNSN